MEFKAKSKMTKKSKSKSVQTDNNPNCAQMVNELCLSCLHKNYCCLRKNKEQASYYCDEYEGIEITSAGKSNFQQQDAETEITTPEEFNGLCKNCEKRFNCSLCKSEGGVWHCEEYQ